MIIQLSHCKFTPVALGAMLAIGIPGAVRAQNVAKPVTLEAVTVTASPENATGPVAGFVAKRSATGTKTDAALMETPQSISVVTREQVEAMQSQNVSEALRYSAGVGGEIYGADTRADWIKIRGFQAPDFLDGLPMPRATYAWARTDPYMLERVEILRGPASVLYGQSPPGGLVNMVSKRPTGTTQREVQLQLGDSNRRQLAADLSGKIGDDGRLSYRVAALGRLSDTQVDHVNDDRTMLAPSLLWRISDQTSLTLLAHYIKADSKSLQFLPSQGTLTANPIGKIPRFTFLGNTDWDDFDFEQHGIGYAFEHRFNPDAVFRQNLRLSRVDYDLQVVRGFGLVPNQFRNVNTRPVLIRDEARTQGVDNQFEYKLRTGAVSHTLLAGLDYQRQETDYNFGVGALRAIDVFNPTNTAIGPINTTASTAQTQRQLGLYVQDQAQIDRLTLLLTARHDELRGDSRNRLNGATTRLDESANTGRVGAIYNFASGLAPYVSYATSFQPNLGVDYTGTALDPTTGQQLEAGVKFQPAAWGNSMLSFAVYDIKQKDVVANNPALNGNEQIGEARVQGAEIEGKANLAAGLDLLASVAYTDSEITRAVRAETVGKALPIVPKKTASLWLSYAFVNTAWSDLSAGIGARYIGGSYANDINSISVPSATLFDLGLQYRLGKLSPSLANSTLALNVANLADKEYVSSCNDVNNCYWGNGRTVRLTLTHRF